MESERKEKMKPERKQLLTGIILGFFAPILVLLVFYLMANTEVGFIEYIQGWIKFDVFTKMFSLCVLINLGLFFIFLWREKMIYARGVLFSTIFWGIFIFVVYFL